MKHARKRKKGKYLIPTLGIWGICFLFVAYGLRNTTKEKQGQSVATNIDIEIPVSSTIDATIEEMSIEQKVAQMFMVRVPEENPVQLLQEYPFGGYILFSENFEGKEKEQVIDEIASYQEVSAIPLLIGVDEEGGTVNRVSTYFKEEPYASPQTIYNEGGFTAIMEDTRDKDAFLQSFGINTNFAPVVDVSTNPGDYMYARSFGKGAILTAQYATKVISIMKNDRMGSVAKHFPGYGNNVNTHTEVAYDNRPYETFAQNDFLPFKGAITSGVDSVLVSHNVVSAIDKDNPSSLSPAVHQILRDDLGFTGVIMADNLTMQGVSEFGTSEEIAVQAVLAGNDMMISSDAIRQYEAVVKAVREGTIPEGQIDASVKRILKWKEDIGIYS